MLDVSPSITTTSAVVYGPDPISVEGRQGSRYWVHHPSVLTGNDHVDERLSGYPVVVFQPHGRPASQTPIVLGLQGMAAPWQWNAFLVPTLLDMGIACVLFDTPFAGERSLSRTHRGDVLSEVRPLSEHGVKVRAGLVPRLMEAVTDDFQIVVDLIAERHGLCDSRRALFGVSLGTLLEAYAFMKHSVGCRLLGTLGHADLQLFARSYAPFITPLAISLPGRLLGQLATLWFGTSVSAALDFLSVLHELCSGGEHCVQANPMTFLDRVGPGRQVRFLVGREDKLVRATNAVACAKRFPDGECYVVPGLGHGQSLCDPSFVEHVRFFIGTQLGDWKW